MKRLALALLLLLTTRASADEPRYILRMASVAPEGTAWARELTNWAHELGEATHGVVRVKWYFGGIAGDETTVRERLARNQLDGTASGGMLCQRAAPSWRITRIPGLYHSRDELSYVLAKLQPVLETEMRSAGLVNLGNPVLGATTLLLRRPVHSFAELKATRLWRWDIDTVGITYARSMGLTVVPIALEQAARSYDHGEVDGFVAIPTAALAFQWGVHASYLTDLPMDYLASCFVVTEHTFAQLTPDQQAALRATVAKLAVRFEELGRSEDRALLGGLFEKQGLKRVPPTRELKAQFFAAAAQSRARLADKLVPKALLVETERLLQQYRGRGAAPR